MHRHVHIHVHDAAPVGRRTYDYGPGQNPNSHKPPHGVNPQHHEVLMRHGYKPPHPVSVGGEHQSHMYEGPHGTVHLTHGGWHHKLNNGTRSGASTPGLQRSLKEPTGRFKISAKAIEHYPHVHYEPG